MVAALLHDVGHLLLDEHMGNEGFLEEDKEHELAGSEWLAPRFPAAVSEAVRLHVAAKRYLCHAVEGYWSGLSAAFNSSKRDRAVVGDLRMEFEGHAAHRTVQLRVQVVVGVYSVNA